MCNPFKIAGDHKPKKEDDFLAEERQEVQKQRDANAGDSDEHSPSG
jgi:hypothetical protein